ncbi:MAG TPA: hypothetical protein VLK25_08640 [Allosphingosinicella sp.]|nr:hypothetical protein [Allosphingosinicella sp.]
MRRNRIELALLAGALLAGTPAPAQEFEAQDEIEAVLGRPKRAPVIPAGLQATVRVSERDRLVVRGLNGADMVIDIAQMEPESFAQYGDGRFFGFSFIGYEFFGYRLIDRRMSGEAAVIETGEAPVFSSDGRYFAAVQVSGAGYGNLEGIAIWRVDAEGTAQIFSSDVLPQGEEWRIDGWPRADCVSVSWTEGQPREGEPPPERRHFGIEVGDTIRVANSDGFPGCNVTDATQADD